MISECQILYYGQGETTFLCDLFWFEFILRLDH